LQNQGPLKNQDGIPTFEEALIDWIIADSQAFTVTESEWFMRIMKAGDIG
jgi:hypothetical protein